MFVHIHIHTFIYIHTYIHVIMYVHGLLFIILQHLLLGQRRPHGKTSVAAQNTRVFTLWRIRTFQNVQGVCGIFFSRHRCVNLPEVLGDSPIPPQHRAKRLYFQILAPKFKYVAKFHILSAKTQIWSSQTQICGTKIQIFDPNFQSINFCTTKNLPLCTRKTPNPASLTPTHPTLGVSKKLIAYPFRMLHAQCDQTVKYISFLNCTLKYFRHFHICNWAGCWDGFLIACVCIPVSTDRLDLRNSNHRTWEYTENIHMRICIYMLIYVRIHIFSHIYIHIYIYVYMYTCIYIHTYIHTYIYIYIHTHTYIYIYICIYVHMYIHIYMYT